MVNYDNPSSEIMHNRKIAKLRSALGHEKNKIAKLIVFEGADRRGKQTQTKMLAAALSVNGYKTAVVEIPFNDGLTSKLIYWMLENGISQKFPQIFQIVQFLNKKIFQRTKLENVVMNNDYVIFDRWSLSAVIYGNVSGTNQSLNKIMYNNLFKPDVTVIIDGNMLASGEDAYEKNTAFQDEVANSYKTWSKETRERVIVVSNVNASKMQMHREVLKKLRQLNIV